MSLPLYRISNLYQSIIDSIETSSDSELEMDLYSELDSIGNDLNEKSINIAAYIKNVHAEIKSIEDAKNEMERRLNRLYSKAEKLEDYLIYNLNKCEIKEIKHDQFDIKVKKCPPSVLIYDGSCIDESYMMKKEVKFIDKNKIKSDILNGVVVEGAKLINNTRLEIK